MGSFFQQLRLHYLSRVVILAVAYFITGKIGLSFPFVGEHVTLIWPPSGIALAAFLGWGIRYWPGVWLGTFLISYSMDGNLWLASLTPTGNVLAPLIGALALKRYADFRPSFERRRDVLAFLTIGVTGSMTISATWGTLSLWVTGVTPWTEFSSIWLIWWLGDAMGVLVVAPTILTWERQFLHRLRNRRDLLEFLAVLAALSMTCGAIFEDRILFSGRHLALAFLPFPVVVWAGLRFGSWMASLTMLIVCAFAVWGTASGTGLFADSDVHQGLELLWVYMGTTTVLALLFTSIESERRAAQHALRASEARLHQILDVSTDGVWEWDIEQDTVEWSDRLYSILGLQRGDCPPTFADIEAMVHPDDRDYHERAVRKHLEEGGPYRVELRLRRADGDHLWILASGEALRDAAGKPRLMRGIIQDISHRKRIEADLDRSNRMLSELVGLTQRLSHAKNLEEIHAIATTSARRLVAATTSILLSRDGDSFVIICEGSSNPQWIGQRFPAARCLGDWVMRNRKSAAVEDVRADDRLAAESYMNLGMLSVAMVPVRTRDPQAVLAVLWDTPYQADAEEVAALETLAEAISVAIDNVDLLEQQATQLNHLEAMDRINRDIMAAETVDQLLECIVGDVLDIVGCDRAWLAFPCDPNAATMRITVEHTRPEYPGAFQAQEEIPVLSAVADYFRRALEAKEPVTRGEAEIHEAGGDFGEQIARKYSIRADVGIALRPRVGNAWILGLHQCSSDRVWTADEMRLITEVGRRLEDALSTLLLLQDLQRSENQFRNIVENMPVMLDAFDRENQIVFWNRECERVTGYAAHEVVGNPAAIDLFYPDPDYRTQMLTEWRDRGNSYSNWEWEIRCKDGTVKTIAWSNVSEEIPIAGWHTWRVGSDVTERDRAFRELAVSESRWKSIVESPFEYVSILDRDLTIRYLNHSIPTIPIDSIVNKVRFTELVRKDQHQRVQETFDRVLTTGESAFFESFAPAVGRWMGNVVGVIRQDGQVVNFVVQTSDITDRKRAEEELRASEQRLERAQEHARLGSWEFDPVREEGSWSKEMHELLDYPIEKGFPTFEEFLELVHPDDRHLLTDETHHVFGTGQPSQTEFRGNPARDVDRVFQSSVHLIEEPKSERRYLVGTVLDITKRKAAERHQSELIQQLEEKNAELERFTYTVSHDLKSPLVTIGGFMGLLKHDVESGDEEGIQRDIRRIDGAVVRMKRLLDELLELSRVGRTGHKPTNVPLAELVEGVIDNLKLQLEDGQISIDVATDLPLVHADPVRIQECLQNLIENAIRFMGDQTNPRIEIGKQQRNAETVIYIRDNGMGIAPEYHERIFNLFERLDTKVDGTGVGLSIVRRIIEVHGGRIWVESEGEGAGTTFFFTLPLGQ